MSVVRLHPVAFMLFETWKSIVGFEGLYDVSDFGRVRRALDAPLAPNTFPGKLLKLQPYDGYLRIGLRDYLGVRTFHQVHRLVARAFLGDFPMGWDVHHKDEDKENNLPDNLEPKPKPEHARFHLIGNMRCRGSRSGMAKLSEEAITKARVMRKEGMTHKAIALILGVHRSIITRVFSGTLWKHTQYPNRGTS